MYYKQPLHYFTSLLLYAMSFVSYSYVPQTGDLVFHQSCSSQSAAIQLATQSKCTHMDMIMTKEGKPYVFEAIPTIRYTPLDKWVARGQNNQTVIKRLKTSLTEEQKQKLQKLAVNYQGKLYDIHFKWDDNQLYCSELTWKMYD